MEKCQEVIMIEGIKEEDEEEESNEFISLNNSIHV
jgi:hypothetical protein